MREIVRISPSRILASSPVPRVCLGGAMHNIWRTIANVESFARIGSSSDRPMRKFLPPSDDETETETDIPQGNQIGAAFWCVEPKKRPR
ncbi:hypothetical protein K504DRAFT_461290 [Pleomassaria siparia CBS 279.74]|uniref:Uncharacterized protein n=1 Tax=Pleomassaria siparia CBS 279.74 TaxID=1314801 RepID=A0A6G1JVK3_9PLEO|nr:hypothetical protein K504DRAFT_461290 [Pleomassaria siparia CBS 279.74]